MMSESDRIHSRALLLQSVGPDEYPFGFWYAMAARQIATEDGPDADGQER